MLRWDALMTALEFLEERTDVVYVQVPYLPDIHVAVDFIMRNYVDKLIWIYVYEKHLVTGRGRVRFEVVSDGRCAFHADGPSFLVERSNGDTGL